MGGIFLKSNLSQNALYFAYNIFTLNPGVIYDKIQIRIRYKHRGFGAYLKAFFSRCESIVILQDVAVSFAPLCSLTIFGRGVVCYKTGSFQKPRNHC